MTDLKNRLLKEFSYNPHTGEMRRLTRRNRWGYYPANDPVGQLSHGYIRFNYHGHHLSVHRTAFLFMSGYIPDRTFDIDHINGIRHDNRWVNLRLASRSENNMNRCLGSNNTTGHTGIHRDKRKFKKDVKRNEWTARIKVNRKIIHLGVFETFEQALSARKAAEEKYFGNFKRIS